MIVENKTKIALRFAVIVLTVSLITTSTATDEARDVRSLYDRTIKAYRKSGDAEAAIRMLQQIVAENANYAPPHLNLALLSELRGDMETAATELETFIRLAPKGPSLQKAKRELLIVKMWQAARSSEKQDNDQLVEGAWRAFRRGQSSEALNVAQKATDSEPNDWRPFLLKGLVYCSQTKYSETVASLKLATQKASGDAQKGLRIFYIGALEQAGGNCIRKKKYSDAASYFLTVHSEIPKNERIALSAAAAAALSHQNGLAHQLLQELKTSKDTNISSRAAELEKALSSSK